MPVAYHEIQTAKLNDILTNGLRQGHRGDKGQDEAIQLTDEFLNSLRPPQQQQAGLDRQRNIYCYLTHEGKIIDITSGNLIVPSEFPARPNHRLIRIEIDPARCYVSDLDTYDAVVQLLRSGQRRQASHLAVQYWRSICRLDQYGGRQKIKRPELMVTYDITTSVIRL